MCLYQRARQQSDPSVYTKPSPLAVADGQSEGYTPWRRGEPDHRMPAAIVPSLWLGWPPDPQASYAGAHRERGTPPTSWEKKKNPLHMRESGFLHMYACVSIK